MRIVRSGKIRLSSAGASGVYSNWLGSKFVGDIWLGRALIDAVVRQYSIISDKIVAFVSQRKEQVTVKKRAR